MNTSVVIIVVSAPILVLILEFMLAWLISGCGLDFNWPPGIFALLWWMAVIGFCAASGYMSVPEGEPVRVEWIVFCMVAGLHIFVRLHTDDPVFEFNNAPISPPPQARQAPKSGMLPSAVSQHPQEEDAKRIEREGPR